MNRNRIIRRFDALLFMAASGQKKNEAISTVYPTRDWVISDFVVTDPAYGAKAEPLTTERPSTAIDAAYQAGAVVHIFPRELRVS